MSYVKVVTEQELLSERAEILARFPELSEIAACCGGCAASVAGDLYGIDGRDAMDKLDQIYFLLGEKPVWQGVEE